jgi:hypothetical protein
MRMKLLFPCVQAALGLALLASPALASSRTPPEATQHTIEEQINACAQRKPECWTATPTPTPTATPSPTSTSTPQPTDTPTPEPTAAATATPEPVCWLTDEDLGDPDNNWIVFDDQGAPIPCPTDTPTEEEAIAEPTDTPTPMPSATAIGLPLATPLPAAVPVSTSAPLPTYTHASGHSDRCADRHIGRRRKGHQRACNDGFTRHRACAWSVGVVRVSQGCRCGGRWCRPGRLASDEEASRGVEDQKGVNQCQRLASSRRTAQRRGSIST